MTPIKIATGFERLAIDINQHISYYIPHCWIVPINDVAIPPNFSENEAKLFFEAHRQGNLKQKLEDIAKTPDESCLYSQVNPWYVQEAIQDFFNKKPYAQYEGELK